MVDVLTECVMIWLAVNATVLATVLGAVQLRAKWRNRRGETGPRRPLDDGEPLRGKRSLEGSGGTLDPMAC